MLVPILLLVSATQAVSTTIVAVCTTDNATIAIDSSFSYVDGKAVSTQHRCKIFRYDRTVFAAAGLATYEDFDVYAAAGAASRSFAPLDQRIKRFEADMMKRLPPAMERVRKEDVKSFEQPLHAGGLERVMSGH